VTNKPKYRAAVNFRREKGGKNKGKEAVEKERILGKTELKLWKEKTKRENQGEPRT